MSRRSRSQLKKNIPISEESRESQWVFIHRGGGGHDALNLKNLVKMWSSLSLASRQALIFARGYIQPIL